MPYKDRDKQREYQRQWMAQRRFDFFRDKSCNECGSTDRLELDHIDSSTKVSHNIWSWSQSRRDEELFKCQVLCHEHHVKKSKAFDWRKAVHGSRTMYEIYKCKCDDCRAVKKIHNAQRNKTR